MATGAGVGSGTATGKGAGAGAGGVTLTNGVAARCPVTKGVVAGGGLTTAIGVTAIGAGAGAGAAATTGTTGGSWAARYCARNASSVAGAAR